MSKNKLKNQAERPHNVTPLHPYDSTSRGYHPEPRKGSSKMDFGIAISLAIVVALFVFFFFVYEVITSGYERFK